MEPASLRFWQAPRCCGYCLPVSQRGLEELGFWGLREYAQVLAWFDFDGNWSDPAAPVGLLASLTRPSRPQVGDVKCVLRPCPLN